MDRQVDVPGRSQFVEQALWSVLEREKRDVAASPDLDILNAYADEINAEAMDVLEYQADW